MERNLGVYLKRVKMTGEMFRIETQINLSGFQRDKVSFINYPNMEELYKNAFESLGNDEIRYKELFLEIEKH